jgi:hypothetical protein
VGPRAVHWKAILPPWRLNRGSNTREHTAWAGNAPDGAAHDVASVQPLLTLCVQQPVITIVVVTLRNNYGDDVMVHNVCPCSYWQQVGVCVHVYMDVRGHMKH